MSTPFGGRGCKIAWLGILLIAFWAAAEPQPTRAFDFFGLFGSEPPPAPSSVTLPYTAKIEGITDSDLVKAVQDTSILYRLRQDAPPSGEGIVRRAEADLQHLPDVISAYGYYAGRVSIEINGVSLTNEGSIAA